MTDLDVVVRGIRGRVIVERAPDRVLISLTVLAEALWVDADTICVGEDATGAEVRYRVIDWDAEARALIALRIGPAVPAIDEEAWRRAIAPLAEHNPETHPVSRSGGAVAAGDGGVPAAAGGGEEAVPALDPRSAGTAAPTEPERDWHQEYKDDLAQGRIYPDGSDREPDEPDWSER